MFFSLSSLRLTKTKNFFLPLRLQLPTAWNTIHRDSKKQVTVNQKPWKHSGLDIKDIRLIIVLWYKCSIKLDKIQLCD